MNSSIPEISPRSDRTRSDRFTPVETVILVAANCSCHGAFLVLQIETFWLARQTASAIQFLEGKASMQAIDYYAFEIAQVG
jgi:hypothetical protein